MRGCECCIVAVSQHMQLLVRPAEGDEAQQIVAEQGDVLSKPIEEFGLESFEDPLS